MRLLKKRIERDRSGAVRLVPQEPEDIWHAYNLIAVGDRVRTSTVRRVQTESSTGSTSSNRVHTTVTLGVERVDYDMGGAGVLRIHGRNVAENRFVRLGAYHNLEIRRDQEFEIVKREWDSVALERVDECCNPARVADVAAVLMQQGLANVCLITNSMTMVRQRVEVSIPRKRRGDTTQVDKAVQRMFELTLQAILHHIDFAVVKVVLLASPAFFKDQFFEYMNAEAVKKDIKVLMENRKKFMLVHCSSGHKVALKEIFQDPAVVASLADTKASGEVRALNQFYEMLHSEPDRAIYGLKSVRTALERQGVDTLLISDRLFRSSSFATRKEYVALVEAARDSRAKVLVFSSSHVTGEQLDQLTGIAAILRVPMPDLEEDDDDNGDEPANPLDNDAVARTPAVGIDNGDDHYYDEDGDGEGEGEGEDDAAAAASSSSSSYYYSSSSSSSTGNGVARQVDRLASDMGDLDFF